MKKILGKTNHNWNSADTVTSLRIVATLLLLFLSLRTIWFYVIYTISGLTDILDGWIARRTGTSSDFGARLDSVADLLFYGVVLFRFIPFLWEALPMKIWIPVAVIVIVRIASYATAAVKYHRFASLHTWLNKLTGFVVFILPYAFELTNGILYSWTVCTLALLSSIEELMIHISSKQYCADRKFIYYKMKTGENL